MQVNNATVSILIELPETIHEVMSKFIEDHPDWDQDRLGTTAVSLFLMQSGDCDRRAARAYLDGMFSQKAA